MKPRIINSSRSQEKGIALITVLILLLLMTGLAAGLMYMAMSQKSLSGGDIQSNTAYYATEAGIENMTAQLANLYQRQQAPGTGAITSLGNNPPNIQGVTWKEYEFSVPVDGNGNPASYSSTITNGAWIGLSAQIVPITLQATAQIATGAQARMMRKVEVALIPVFQFGVFSDMDLSYHAGPDFHFAGRVHTNGNLFLSGQGTTVFNDKITVAQKIGANAGTAQDNQIFRTVLPNFASASGNGYTGLVLIPNQAMGCSSNNITWATNNTTTCKAISMSQGTVTSVSGTGAASGYNQPITFTPTLYTGSQGWVSDVSTGIFKGYLMRDTPQLVLPFINTSGNPDPSNPDPLPIEIIRRPRAGEDVTSNLGSSRLYNQAVIRIMLDDDPCKLSAASNCNDGDNIPLQATYATSGPNWDTNTYGYLHLTGTGVNTGYFPIATATTSKLVACTTSACSAFTQDANWSYPYVDPYGALNGDGSTYLPSQPLQRWVTRGGRATSPVLAAAAAPGLGRMITYNDNDAVTPTANAARDWPLMTGWIRVEVKDGGGNWKGVTRQWLSYGFSRGTQLSDTEHATSNPTDSANYSNPSGINGPIIYLQAFANRRVDGTGGQTNPAVGTVGNPLQNSWAFNASTYPKYAPYMFYPLNFYDTREGEIRDHSQTNGSNANNNTLCSLNGIMNAVELDVGHLRSWLLNTSDGQSVDSLTSNGYILYFSDRRGSSDKSVNSDGGYDFLDTINEPSSTGFSWGTLDPSENVYSTPKTPSGNWGAFSNPGTDTSSLLLVPPKYIGNGFGLGYLPAMDTTKKVFHQVSCMFPLNTSGNATPNLMWGSSTSSAGAGRANLVMGPRHVLRLVDGTLGNLPKKADNTGGFTVASEQPVYIAHNYNANDSTTMNGATANWGTNDSAAAVIADSVTLLSNSWSDLASVWNPNSWNWSSGTYSTSDGPNTNTRIATETRYRVAIAAGKNKPFYTRSYASVDWGSDGGVHNFLRFLENWGSTTAHYQGSMVTLFYAAYDTGPFKCCQVVYSPPTRDYSFDTLFENPTLMPPGTPRFIQVVNTAFRQDLTPKQVQ